MFRKYRSLTNIPTQYHACILIKSSLNYGNNILQPDLTSWILVLEFKRCVPDCGRKYGSRPITGTLQKIRELLICSMSSLMW